ncbi:MAG: phospholipid carrier-dependent glycosyltransferase [Methanocellales archaeon]|nr:phospholipid carrier-dependent glycosyltransferase [Methanocellales archaeon]
MERREELLKISLILLVSLIVRVLLFPAEGYYIDVNTFTAWHASAAEGLRTFYDRGWSDYPPFSIYIFWIFGSIAKHFSLFNTEYFVYLLKLPSNLFDLGISFLIFFFLRKKIGFNHAAFIMVIYAFNPGTIYNLAVWGQMGSFYTFFMIASIIFLIYEKPELSASSLAVAMLTKPQSVAILPIIAFFIIRKYDLKRVATSIAASAASVFLIILPFRWSNPIEFLIGIYSTGYEYYAYNSVSAYNIWAFAGFWKPDSQPLLFLSSHIWGIILFGALVLFVLYHLNLNKKYDTEPLIFSCFLLSFGFFMLMTRMHERYMFPVFAILALIMNHEKIKTIYYILTATYLFNLAYVLSFINKNNFIPDNNLSLTIVPLINLAILAYSIHVMRYPGFLKKIDKVFNLTKPDLKKLGEMVPDKEVVSKIKITRRDVALMLILSVTFFSIAVFNLGATEMPVTYWHSLNEVEGFYIDLGSLQPVERIALFIKEDSLTKMNIYYGGPNDWRFSTNYVRSGVYYFWDDIPISCDTRYIRFDFDNPSSDIGEIAVFGEGSKKRFEIKSITDEYGNAQTHGRDLKKLIDEQSLVEEPLIYRSGTYFDEIYFVRTAYEHMDFTEPFEWTHPPLSKLIIACGILLFGSNPFAWRLMGVIFATAAIPVMFMFGKKISGTSLGGFIAAFLITFDFMHFTEARLATGDTFIVFFLILMFYFFFTYFQGIFKKGWKDVGRPLFLSTLFFGLAFSTKWYAMYGFIGMAFLFILLKLKEFSLMEKYDKKDVHKYLVYPLSITFFALAISIIIYLLTYIPHMLAGYNLADVINLQFTMYGYHSSLTASHPFASYWRSWPLILKPMWIYSNNLDGMVSTIVLMGNPAIWWLGAIFLILTATKMVRDRDKTCMFIVVLFLFQWLPYAPISRALFIYHFYANVPFMALAITYWMNNLWEGKAKWLVISYLLVTLILFFVYYPVISGYPISYEYKEGLRFLESWIF